jgi:hypothetical protein
MADIAASIAASIAVDIAAFTAAGNRDEAGRRLPRKPITSGVA